MKLSQTKKIDDKEYKLSELTVQQIITLVNDASFYKKEEEKKPESIEEISEELVVNGILDQIEGFNLVKKDLENMMKLCCDFTLQDMIKLAPSEIEQLITVFKEVNKPFLSVLTSLKIPEVLKDMWDVFLTNFLKRLVT